MNVLHIFTSASRLLASVTLLGVVSACATANTRPAPPSPPTLIPTTVPTRAAEVPTLIATVLPSPTLPPTPPPVAAPTDAEIAAGSAQRLVRDQIVLAREIGSCRAAPLACPDRIASAPRNEELGATTTFFVTRSDDNTNLTITATLRYAGSVVLMYVEEGADVDQAELDAAAKRFEDEIYPRTREIFGSEDTPGLDGDPRITVLNTISIDGNVLGYFAARDALPRQINRFSNEREMFVMNIDSLDVGGTAYVDVLSHEFQHMIHRNERPQTATWFNEGNSTLSEDLNGFIGQGYALTYLGDPDTQLNTWSDQPGRSIAHYGAAHLFMRYFFAQYASESDLRGLIQTGAGDNLERFTELAAQRRPDLTAFPKLVADWAVANLLDDPSVGDGRFTYRTRPETENFLPNTLTPQFLELGETSDTVAQLGADYYRLPSGPAELEFRGATRAALVDAVPQGRLAWWSGRGDSSVATLTRPVDLRAVSSATLQFSAWYEIEQGYDYAFVSVSADDGTTWQPLRATDSQVDDPQGHNYGFGLTGVSGSDARPGEAQAQWVDQRVDLSAFAGQQVLLRFWLINDEGFNAPGLLLDNLSIPEIGWRDDVETGAAGWQAQGFVRVDGDLEQQWELRFVRTSADGVVQVEALPVDAEGYVRVELAEEERGVLVVVAATGLTTEPATYTLSLR